MELRTKLRKTRKFETGASDSPDEEDCASSIFRATSRISSGVSRRASLPSFNPTLPPAAFPTLNEPRPPPIAGENRTQTHTQARSSKLFLEAPSLHSRPRRSSPSANTAHVSAQQTNKQDIDSEFSEGNEYGLDRALKEHSNGPENATYMHNMKILQRQFYKSDEDWILQEMETSDEDKPSPRAGVLGSEINTTQKTTVGWEDLSVLHRLEIIDAMIDCYPSRGAIMERLHLTNFQSQQIGKLERRRSQVCAVEDGRILALQNEVTQILLGNYGSQQTLTHRGFRRMLSHYLGPFVNEENDFFTTTAEELRKAKSFLYALGLDASFIGCWKKAFDLDKSHNSDPVSVAETLELAPGSRNLPEKKSAPISSDGPLRKLFQVPQPPNPHHSNNIAIQVATGMRGGEKQADNDPQNLAHALEVAKAREYLSKIPQRKISQTSRGNTTAYRWGPSFDFPVTEGPLMEGTLSNQHRNSPTLQTIGRFDRTLGPAAGVALSQSSASQPEPKLRARHDGSGLALAENTALVPPANQPQPPQNLNGDFDRLCDVSRESEGGMDSVIKVATKAPQLIKAVSNSHTSSGRQQLGQRIRNEEDSTILNATLYPPRTVVETKEPPKKKRAYRKRLKVAVAPASSIPWPSVNTSNFQNGAPLPS